MKVGYVDERDRFFCPACWGSQVTEGGHPRKVLDDEGEDADEVFWIVDNCVGCAVRIQYKGVRLLA